MKTQHSVAKFRRKILVYFQIWLQKHNQIIVGTQKITEQHRIRWLNLNGYADDESIKHRCTVEKKNGNALNYKNGRSWGGKRKREVVLRKGERRQTHKRYFSQSTKLPLKILPCHGPADSFTYMSTIFP